MLHHRNDKRTKCQRRRIVAAMGNSGMPMANCSGAVLVAESSTHEENLVAPREQAVGTSIIGLEGQCFLEKRDGLGCFLRHRDKDVWKRAQNEIIGVETVRPFAFHTLDFSLPQARLNRTDDAQGNFVLYRENVVERSIVPFCPEMPPVSASTSWLVMRTRLPALRILPSR